MSILNAFRSEWILLNRKRLWLVLGAITTVYTVVATALVLSTAEPLLQQSEDGARSRGAGRRRRGDDDGHLLDRLRLPAGRRHVR